MAIKFSPRNKTHCDKERKYIYVIKLMFREIVELVADLFCCDLATEPLILMMQRRPSSGHEKFIQTNKMSSHISASQTDIKMDKKGTMQTFKNIELIRALKLFTISFQYCLIIITCLVYYFVRCTFSEV